jgi:hypothetical protein
MLFIIWCGVCGVFVCCTGCAVSGKAVFNEAGPLVLFNNNPDTPAEEDKSKTTEETPKTPPAEEPAPPKESAAPEEPAPPVPVSEEFQPPEEEYPPPEEPAATGVFISVVPGLGLFHQAGGFANDDVHGAAVDHDELGSVYTSIGARVRYVSEKKMGFGLGLDMLFGKKVSQAHILSADFVYALEKPVLSFMPFLKGGPCVASFEWKGPGEFHDGCGLQFGAGGLAKIGDLNLEVEAVYRFLHCDYVPSPYSTRLNDKVDLSGLSLAFGVSMGF